MSSDDGADPAKGSHLVEPRLVAEAQCAQPASSGRLQADGYDGLTTLKNRPGSAGTDPGGDRSPAE